MIRCPTRELIQVCSTPSPAVTTAIAIMPATSHTSRVTFCWGSATSSTARSRNGVPMPTIEVTTIIALTASSGRR
jgi:hypothetical protein